MQWRNTKARYGVLSKALHWGMALAILAMIPAGILMTDMEVSPQKFELYGIHKATGMVLLVVIMLRFVWRQRETIPPQPQEMKPHERLAAHGTHYAFYVLLLAMPLSGWLMSSAAGFSPTSARRHFARRSSTSSDARSSRRERSAS